MLIALLALLGVNLVVIAVLVVGVLGRRRWVSHQPGSFRGVAHVRDGEIPNLGSKPRRGYGRWVRDVLVWTPAPFFLRNALAPVNAIEGTANPTGKVRRLGDNPRVVTLILDGARIEIVVRAEDVVHVTTAFTGTRRPAENTAAPNEKPDPTAAV
jgi:hypothetical protein